MNIPFQLSETPTEQEFYIAQFGQLKFYCMIIFNRTKWSREQTLENWGTYVSVYSNGKPLERAVIAFPEPFENVTGYCLAKASEICNEWLNIHQPDYVVSI